MAAEFGKCFDAFAATEHRNGFDERDRLTIEQGRYFEPHRETLRGLFDALGEVDMWSEDPRDMVSGMQQRWIGGEHGNDATKAQYTEEQIAAAQPYLEELRLTGEIMPNFEELDGECEALLLGGTMVALHRRSLLLEKALASGKISRASYIVGMRPRDAKRDGENEEILSADGRFGGHDIENNPWVRAYLRRALESDDPWEATETVLGRTAALKAMGDGLTLRRIDLPILRIYGNDTGLPLRHQDTPPRDVLDYTFEHEIEGREKPVEVTLVNTAPVARRQGDPRPTTTSGIGEWLDRHVPPQDAKVLYITGNPSALRTTRSAHKVLQERGRGDVQLIPVATAPAGHVPIQTALGEIARLIEGDVKANYQAA